MSKVKTEDGSGKENFINCPVCNRVFEKSAIEEHVNKCLFLNAKTDNNVKRKISQITSPSEKRSKISNNTILKLKELTPSESTTMTNANQDNKGLPLAESLRPINLNDIIGHKKIFGTGTMLHSLLEQRKIPNMILWGPPGCGKTSLANVISHICKEQDNMRFVKLSATMSGVSDVKEIVKVAKNEMQFKRRTVLFMDEIHRFNKLQQDTFLPHVESGVITLIGATTENPSFSLNNALLSRCRVIVMEKLFVDDVITILKRAIEKSKQAVISNNEYDVNNINSLENVPKYIVEERSLKWLAEVSDGDARIALGALELVLSARKPEFDSHTTAEPTIITLDDIKESIKRSHMLYDRKSEEHYNTISALQKSIRASDENAALYWTVRAMHAGEDPLYIARRLIRTACEDIGLADQNALVEAVACLQGCQHIGMPESDVLLAQCAVRLARAPKSQEVYKAMKRCQRTLSEAKGPLPPIPLHLRNAPTKLMKELGYGNGYNTLHKDMSNLHYMPTGMEDIDFFHSPETDNMD